MAIIQKAIAKLPGERYQTAVALMNDLTELVGTDILTKTPAKLRHAAQATIADIQQGQANRQDKIEATLATFAAQRAMPSDVTTPSDQPTVLVRDQKAGLPRSLIFGGVAVVIALVVIAGLALGGGAAEPTPTPSPTHTEVVIVPTDTPTRTPTVTSTPLPTVTRTSTVTPSPIMRSISSAE